MKSSAKREYLSLLKCIFLFPMFFLIPQTAWQASQILFTIFREAFKLFDRNRDGFIDTRELKKVIATGWQLSIWLMLVMQVTGMLGTMLTKEELEEFMREADVVSSIIFCKNIVWLNNLKGWQRETWLRRVCENAAIDARRQILINWLFMLYTSSLSLTQN